MNTQVFLQRNTNHPKVLPCVSFTDTDEAPYELRQIGPVYNNIITYRGVYATRAAAEKAVRDYKRN